MKKMSENINLNNSSENGSTMSGNININNCTGSYETMSGNITCYECKCKSLETMSGNIECKISKIKDINTMSGNIDLINSSCNDINTMSGDIYLQDLSTDFVSCMSSKIHLNNANIKKLVIHGTKIKKRKKLFGIIPLSFVEDNVTQIQFGNNLVINNVSYKNLPSIHVTGSCTIEKIICDSDEHMTIKVYKMPYSGLRNDCIENGTLDLVD